MKQIFLAAFGLIALIFAQHAQAQSLDSRFDPRTLSVAEKRLLQAGASLDGTYEARLDGLWGGGSQRALERAVRRRGATGPLMWRDVAAYAADVRNRLDSGGWAVVNTAQGNASALLPLKDMENQRGPETDYKSRTSTLRLRASLSNQGFAKGVHIQLKARAIGGAPLYSIERENFEVTSGVLADGVTNVYARTDRTGRAYATTLVEFREDRKTDARLIIASIQQGRQELPAISGGALERAVRLLERGPAPTDDSTSDDGITITTGDDDLDDLLSILLGVDRRRPVTPEDPGDDIRVGGGSRAGVGFYVNNTDLVLPEAVVSACGANNLSLSDGTRLQLLGRGAAFGVRFATSPRRSGHWLAIGRNGLPPSAEDFRAIGVDQNGWDSATTRTEGVDILGKLAGAQDTQRFVLALAPARRLLGAPVLDREGKVAGIALGAIEREGLSRAQERALKGFSLGASAAGLRTALAKNGIAYDAGLPSARVYRNDAARAVVPVLCR